MPLFLQGQPAFPPDIYFEQRAGHGIKPGGEDDVVKLVLNIVGNKAFRGESVNRVLAHIDKCDVVTVVGGVVVGVALGSKAKGLIVEGLRFVSTTGPVGVSASSS